MTRYLNILFLLFMLFSCKNIKVEKSSSRTNEIQEARKNVLNRKLGDYMSDTNNFVWTAKHSDTSGYLCEIIFKKDFLLYVYHGQCIYYYFTNYYRTGIDEVELFWSYKTDCEGGVDFLEKSNGIKKHPKRGDAFCNYKLINDTTIKANYYFPDWIKKVNMIAHDSMFPNFLYLKKEGGI